MIKGTRYGGEWTGGPHWMDGTPFYRLIVPGKIEGEGDYTDSYTHPVRWHCSVVSKRVPEYRGGPKRALRYTAIAEDCRREITERTEGIHGARAARAEAERLMGLVFAANGIE